MENKKIWYAVLMDDDDDDWGYGSENRTEAIEMAENIGEDAYIAVIDTTDDDPLCIAEIRRNEDGEWESSIESEHFQY